MDLPQGSQRGLLLAAVAVVAFFTYYENFGRSPLPVPTLQRPDSEQTDSRTFRIRGIPLDWDTTRLLDFLGTLKNSSSPAIKSLALEMQGRSKTATVIFQSTSLQNHKLLSDHGLTIDDSFLGITTLYSPLPNHHKVDIIAISGLGGHAFGSFKERGGGYMWLRDSLPNDIILDDSNNPIARVMIYGYESSVIQSKSMQNLEDLATAFHASLLPLATGPIIRPIILIAHSLGGLITKQALISISKSKQKDDKRLIQAVYGIVFFGVPHDGMEISSLIPMVGDNPNRFLIESISRISSQVLSIQQREFPTALGKEGNSEIFCFYETLESPTARKDKNNNWTMTGQTQVLVTKGSATHCRPWEDGSEHICAINRTHSEMVKFRPQDHEYDKVCERVKGLARRALIAPNLIQVSDVKYTNDPDVKSCLRALFMTDPAEDKSDLKRKKGKRASGTCEWIIDMPELAAWLDSEPLTDVLWLYGNPGTGKSTMAIFLAEELSETFGKMKAKTLAYFFCDSSFETRRTATSIIRGLLLQLVQQHPQLIEYLLPKYKERGAKAFESFDAIWAIFMQAATDSQTGRKYCIIDALDECSRESREVLLDQLQEVFLSWDKRPNFQFLITSRPYPEIREHLKSFRNKDLASYIEIKQDIDQCINEKVAHLATLKNYTDKVKGQVSEILSDKAQGIFLWVGLACKELESKPSSRAVEFLQDMPDGLHAIYRKLLDTALEEEPEEADTIRHILGFVAVSRHPLNVLQLAEACKLYQEEDDVATRHQYTIEKIAFCRLMVIVQDEMVLLLHQSVKDYLIGDRSNCFLVERKEHAYLAYRCIDLLIEQFDSNKLDNSMLDYAITSWTYHAHKANENFKVKDQHDKFFTTHSSYGEKWLRLLRLKDRNVYLWDKILGDFSILHIAAYWDIVGLVGYALRSGDQNLTQKGLDCVDVYGSTPLELAVREKYKTVLPILLEKGVTVSFRAVETAAKNQDGKRVMQMLLKERGSEIAITEEVVKAAAGNWEQGKKVIQLLLEQRGSEITITEEVVRAAAGNPGKGEEVMQLLLEQRGSEITITEEVVKAAAGNPGQGEEVMQLLLEQRGSEITITEEVVKAVARNWGQGEEVMQLLLEQRGSEITITEEVVKAVARNWGQGEEMMQLLLEKRGSEITITEEVVKAAAGNPRKGEEVMQLLLEQRGSEITITEEVVSIFAESFSNSVMQLLLEQRGSEITITEEVVKAVARNWGQGEEVMQLLLEKRGSEITITEEVVKAAAGNPGKGEEVMQLLLEQRGSEITITEEVVSIFAESFSNSVMQLLLEQRGREITITEEVVKAAARNREQGGEVMQLLLEQRGSEITITEEVVKAAARNWEQGGEVMQLLLEQRGSEITITEEVVKAAAGNPGKGEEVMQLLLDANRVDVNAKDNSGQAPLLYAAGSGHLEVVKLLLEKGADLTITNNDGWTPLNAASESGHLKVVKLLLEKGADLTIADNNGWTPLNAASKSGHLEVVKLLLEKGADLTITNGRGSTPLNSASESGHLEVVKLLLEKGADLTIADNNGWTPLNAASESGHLKVVKLLLEKGADLTIADNNGWTPLNAASESGHLEVVKLLLEKGADLTIINNDGWTPLNAASESGHLKVVKLLLEKGADLTIADNNGWTPLNAASESGHLEVVKLLLEKGADLTITNNDGWTPLNAASESGHLKVVKLLLEKGADLTITNGRGSTPLNSASESGHLEVVKLLLEKGADLTIADNNGWTPLNAASESGHLEVVKLLLEKGADLTITNNDGWTPLNAASESGHLKIVKLLLEKGADLTIADNNGWTPLNAASESGHLEVVKLLLEKGADPTITNGRGSTPLNSASESGHLEVVKLLLEKGADLTIADSNGHISLLLASRCGYAQVIRELLAHDSSQVNTVGWHGSTPLFAAVRNGHEKVVELLLAVEGIRVSSRDGFGRDPLWWANRCGNRRLSNLLLVHAESQGIYMNDDKDLGEDILTPFSQDSAWCDACLLCIPANSAWFGCKTCNDFCICLVCYEIGVRCQDGSHSFLRHEPEPTLE